MRSHAPLCVLPPCASSLLWAGRIRGLTLSPVSLCSLPALSCTHLDRPHDLSFRISSPPDADGHSSFSPAASTLCPCPASIRLPAHGISSAAPDTPCGDPARQTDIMPNRKWAPPLPCLPDLSLPVEHRHIELPSHYASPPGRLPLIKRRGRKAGASLPPVSAAVPRVTDLVSGCT